MLKAITIQDVVLIERLSIDFEAGLGALTGETGAGKSILLDSLGLALGARADSGLVRKGAEQATVSAVFEVSGDHPAFDILRDAAMDFEGEDLILRRSITKDGRSRAYINDQPVTAGLLKQVGMSLVEIHGQFDTQGLLDSATHRQLLDDYAGIGGDITALYEDWQQKREELESLKEVAVKSREQEEYLRQAVEDLDALSPQAGEEESLSALRASLMHREQVMEALNSAYNVLNGEHDPVRTAWSTLERVADKLGGQGGEAISALDRASAEVQEALAAIAALSSDLEHSEHDLESIDDRLFALRGQARKHGCTVDELAAVREKLAQSLNMIEHEDEVIAAKMKEVETAFNRYKKEAQDISAARKKAAAKLDELVARELPPLKLEKARFVTQVDPLEESQWGPHGMDQVRFLVATNPGAEPGPLHKIASGGEMARFMLALKVVMAEVGAAGTLVFDEVDSGIGGATAAAVGDRLAQLAKLRQVLVVTHSPQVAASAAHHWIVQKSGAQELKTSVVRLPEFGARREEIARMLSGASITDEARAAADKLLEGRAA